MAIKKKSARQSFKRTHSPKKIAPTRQSTKLKRSRTDQLPKVTAKTLEALSERLDMMLPEVMFRIAAIEHLLVKNQLCSYDELVNARQFIQEQERS